MATHTPAWPPAATQPPGPCNVVCRRRTTTLESIAAPVRRQPSSARRNWPTPAAESHPPGRSASDHAGMRHSCTPQAPGSCVCAVAVPWRHVGYSTRGPHTCQICSHCPSTGEIPAATVLSRIAPHAPSAPRLHSPWLPLGSLGCVHSANRAVSHVTCRTDVAPYSPDDPIHSDRARSAKARLAAAVLQFEAPPRRVPSSPRP